VAPLIVYMARRVAHDPRHAFRVAMKLTGFSTLILIAYECAYSYFVCPATEVALNRNDVMLTLTVVVLTRACDAWRDEQEARLRQVQAGLELSLADIRLLDSQLRPHFVFNALNGALGLLADDVGAAQRLLALLRQFLTESFDAAPVLIRLEEELSLVLCYAQIEQIRFGNVRLTVNADAEARSRLVPRMLLQPLIENAIRHGRDGEVAVHASADDQRLTIVIENQGAVPSGRAGEGIGVANARARLSAVFGARGLLTLVRNTEGLVRVQITVPGGGEA
ncbi:MAG: hypothetical protein QOH21_399, partial [Acidobacteriota bacterium]|nr:hypothetical protein [Acidobacteriota bacterium]